MSRLTRKMSCKIKEKNRISFERNCGKQSWYVFGISTLRQKIVQPACRHVGTAGHFAFIKRPPPRRQGGELNMCKGQS